MAKHNQTLLARLRNRQHKLNRSLIFAAIFGVIAVGIGLSQIFAQSSVAFLYSPYYQNANVNDEKTFSITLYSNNQQIDGGSVHVTYDASLVAFASFSDSASPGVSISNKASSSGNFSYDFQIAFGSQSNPSLGSITLKALSTSTTKAAYLRFDPATTNAYVGVGSGRSNYSAGYGEAAMVVNASSPAPAPTPTPTPTPSPTPTSPSTTKPTQTAPTTSSTPPASTPSQTQPSQNSSTTPPATSPTSTSVTVLPNTSATTLTTKHRRSLLPFILIGLGIGLLGLAAFRYFRPKGIRRHARRKTAKSASAPPAETSSDTTTENAVVKPTVASSLAATALQAPAATPHEYPRIITQHEAHQPKPHPVAQKHDAAPQAEPQPQSKSPPVAPSPRPEPANSQQPSPLEMVTQVKEKTDDAHHKEVEVDLLRVKPAEHHTAPQPPIPPAPQPEPPKTVKEDSAPPQSAPLAHQVSPVGHQPAPAHPKPHHVTIQPPEPHAAPKPVTRTATVPSRHVPDWQTQLGSQSTHKVAADDEPPDMFELAAEHPETFGSLHVLEAEDQKPAPKKDTK